MARDNIGVLVRLSESNPDALSEEGWRAVREHLGGAEPVEVVESTSRAEPPIIVQEMIVSPDYYDPDDRLGPSGGGSRYMRRITSMARRKDLNPMQHERMLKLAAHLWDRNPLAARIIKRAVNYVLGEGVTVVARHESPEVKERIQKIIDEFWFDSRNRMDKRLLKWCLSWRAYGEIALRLTVNPANGLVRLAYVSPEMVMSVKPEKDDIEQINHLVIRTKDGDIKGQEFRAVRVIGADEITQDEKVLDVYYSGVQDAEAKKARAAGRMHGQVFYFATNVLPDMVRGRSDLLAIGDIIDGYDQFIWNRMERQAMLLAFIWSVTLKGASQAEIDKFILNHSSVPKPGSLQVHNENTEWNPLSPTLGSGDAQAEADLMLSYLTTSQGMPPMWFGQANDPNRANGENLTGPTLKDMTGLQNEFKGLVAAIIHMVIDQAVIHGRLPANLDTRQSYEVQMPDLSVLDMATTATTLNGMANALAMARQYKLVDLETSQELFLLAMAPTGVSIKIEELRKRIEKDQETIQKEQLDDAERQFTMQQDQAARAQDLQQQMNPPPPPEDPEAEIQRKAAEVEAVTAAKTRGLASAQAPPPKKTGGMGKVLPMQRKRRPDGSERRVAR